MGIFSHDEEPDWSDIASLQEQIAKLEKENKKLKAEKKELIGVVNAVSVKLIKLVYEKDNQIKEITLTEE
jgi:hypothetical protein